MSSAAKAKLAGLFITSNTMVPMRQTLVKMGWLQPKSPIQTEKSTYSEVTNNTILAKHIKSMDMRLCWLQCREYQVQFRFYWVCETEN